MSDEDQEENKLTPTDTTLVAIGMLADRGPLVMGFVLVLVALMSGFLTRTMEFLIVLAEDGVGYAVLTVGAMVAAALLGAMVRRLSTDLKKTAGRNITLETRLQELTMDHTLALEELEELREQIPVPVERRLPGPVDELPKEASDSEEVH